mmetsp:Transcript_34736/g.110444  ORF Transcript_34736/g.110444 Transcript_34736/m.110444 type:complete len:215 (+) Transcript_34736:636-1280(+)
MTSRTLVESLLVAAGVGNTLLATPAMCSSAQERKTVSWTWSSSRSGKNSSSTTPQACMAAAPKLLMAVLIAKSAAHTFFCSRCNAPSRILPSCLLSVKTRPVPCRWRSKVPPESLQLPTSLSNSSGGGGRKHRGTVAAGLLVPRLAKAFVAGGAGALLPTMRSPRNAASTIAMSPADGAAAPRTCAKPKPKRSIYTRATDGVWACRFMPKKMIQ